MGSFFRSEYDLFVEVRQEPKEFLTKALIALSTSNRKDLEEDVKDAVQQIVVSKDFEEAYDSCTSLMTMFQDSFGISEKIQKRD